MNDSTPRPRARRTELRSAATASGLFVLIGFIAAACGTGDRTDVGVNGPLAGNESVVRNTEVLDGDRIADRADVVVRADQVTDVGQKPQDDLRLTRQRPDSEIGGRKPFLIRSLEWCIRKVISQQLRQWIFGGTA